MFKRILDKNELTYFIDGVRMLANGVLYQLFGNMNIEPVDEPEKETELKALLNNFILKQLRLR